MSDPRPYPAVRAGRWLRRQYDGLMKADHWRIGIVPRPIHTFLEEPHIRDVDWFPVPPGRDRYVADPFGCGDAGSGTILVEDYDHRGRHGRLAAYRLSGLDVTGPVAVREFAEHASYPYLFPVGDEWWCVPEIAKAGQVRVFRFDPVELRLTDLGVLLGGVRLVDPTVFEWNRRWWLLGTDLDRGPNSYLRAWWTEELPGPWSAHELDPLKVDAASARGAGTPFVHDGVLYRPAQDCSGSYGAGVTIQRVLRLDPTGFEEIEAARVDPDSAGSCPDGLHTLSAFGTSTLVDGTRHAFSAPAFRHELAQRCRAGAERLKTSRRPSPGNRA